MSRFVLIATFIVAGEMIFGLPFHTTRFFRPTMLEVFGFSNTQLGDVFAAYGIAAILSYFPGGALADRFPARWMLTVSLLATAAGGFYMATMPGFVGMVFLYAWWGVSTIFLFWGALIRATRIWGGSASQGKAFGILEGGRGLVAATFAAFAVAVFASLMPPDVLSASDDERQAAFRVVIHLYSGITVVAAALTWWLIPGDDDPVRASLNPLVGMLAVLPRPVVWAQAGIIVCAYCGYKGLDNYSLYAAQVLGMNEVDSARFVAWGSYIRPVAAVAAGILADRYGSARSLGVTFAILVGVYAPLSMLGPGEGLGLIYANLIVSFFAVFALRAVYFALLEENRTPTHLTGATVGLVSFVGFAPDFFFGAVTGRILDATPGIGGFQNYFVFLTAVAALGALIVVWLLWQRRRGSLWPSQQPS